MSRNVVVRLRAFLDAADLAQYIARNSLDASIRFADAFDETCKKLGDSPALGAPWEPEKGEPVEFWYWPVKGFPNHLIFFRQSSDNIDVARVFHASRNLKEILETP